MLFKARQRFDKYRIEGKLGEGGFAHVYRAMDTIEGVRVALKVPRPHLVNSDVLDDFRREVRLAAQLDHPNILQIKNASFVQDKFVIVYALGERTLDERMRTRISFDVMLDFAEQMLSAVAHAHHHRIIHCDIKPENMILFPNNRLRLADFGIARVAQRTLKASGSGTMGYMAPEQAMGRPSFRSDVFSLGLILWRMFTGQLPEWPFAWPPPGDEKARRRLHPDLIRLLQRALEVDPRKRFADADQMLTAFRALKRRALMFRSKGPAVNGKRSGRDWKAVRRQQFQQQFGKLLQTNCNCEKCDGPVAEGMHWCPWCGKHRPTHTGYSSFPIHCPRCHRGMKLDWRYCPWCYGAGFEPQTLRRLSDARYNARCSNPACDRKLLMPFMRYCPWCRKKVRKKWTVAGATDKCKSCGWGFLPAYWSHCPWCGKSP
ncbi:MAG: protein kinase [Pirellulaceae bacterium]|nr:protein kinase [Planctomycetales bacterium]